MQVELAREEFPQAPAVVPRNGVADEEVARELGVIERRLVADGLKMYLGRMNHLPFSSAHDTGPVDEGLAVPGG